jgi:hypothetical protein
MRNLADTLIISQELRAALTGSREGYIDANQLLKSVYDLVPLLQSETVGALSPLTPPDIVTDLGNQIGPVAGPTPPITVGIANDIVTFSDWLTANPERSGIVLMVISVSPSAPGNDDSLLLTHSGGTEILKIIPVNNTILTPLPPGENAAFYQGYSVNSNSGKNAIISYLGIGFANANVVGT